MVAQGGGDRDTASGGRAEEMADDKQSTTKRPTVRRGPASQPASQNRDQAGTTVDTDDELSEGRR